MCVSAENSVRVNVGVGMAALGLAFILYSLTNEPFRALIPKGRNVCLFCSLV